MSNFIIQNVQQISLFFIYLIVTETRSEQETGKLRALNY